MMAAAACRLSENVEPHRGHAREHDTEYASNDILQLPPTVTVHDAKNLSIGGASRGASSDEGDKGSTSSSSSSDISPPGSTNTSSVSSPMSYGARLMLPNMEVDYRYSQGTSSSPTNSGHCPKKEDEESSLQSDLSGLDTNVGKVREKFEDLSSNNNNLHFVCSPAAAAGEKRRFHRRSLVRTNSSACDSISEDGNESESSSSSSTTDVSPRLRPPLQRNAAIQDVPGGEYPPLRCISPINIPIEELETCSGVKTVIRRPAKTQNGRSSPSWRWSVMGVATGDYDAVTRATRKGQHHLNHHLTSTPTPTSGAATHNNGHSVLSRRSSLGLSGTPPSVISPRTKRLSTEFRRLSLQMDMPWRDPNERLVKFADWLIKRTEELMERGARARQKTYDLLRLAKQRQKDPIVF